ncbi:hypothetical protein EON65_07465 [archaeon]|nr:MAG: hypothetical protein EON65_07465 [archaeon]
MEMKADTGALSSVDSPMVVCPAMQGYVQLRVLPLQTSADEVNKPFRSCYLSLEVSSSCDNLFTNML